jgi:hypothetical protein
MSTKSTLWYSKNKEYHIYEETLESPILREDWKAYYPVHLQVTNDSMEIDIKLPDDLSIQLAKAKRA